MTLELPWRENEREVSCIPNGTYKLEPTVRKSNNEPAIIVHEVPGRDEILIHVGNSVHETKGCILLGRYFIGGGRIPAEVHNSKDGFEELLSIIESQSEEITLEIINCEQDNGSGQSKVKGSGSEAHAGDAREA